MWIAPVLVWVVAGMVAYGAGGTTGEAIEKSDVIVVGDVAGGKVVDHVTSVECWMPVRADRIIKGDPALARSVLDVHWQYQPRQDQPPQVTTRLERPHGMWFLRRSAEGRYEALWVEVNLQNRGGYYLELPRGEPYGAFAYPPGAGYQEKLAGELAAALEQLAQSQGSALDIHWRSEGMPAPAPPSPAALQFRSLAFTFRELDLAKAPDIARYLANSPLIHLKALGLVAQLKAKNRAALLELEKNLPGLAMTEDPLGLSYWAAGIDIRGDVDAIRAVGRMAVGETELPGFADLAVNH